MKNIVLIVNVYIQPQSVSYLISVGLLSQESSASFSIVYNREVYKHVGHSPFADSVVRSLYRYDLNMDSLVFHQRIA